MKEPTLGNPQNTIEVLQKYNFVFQEKVRSELSDRYTCTGQNYCGSRDYKR